MPAAAVDRGFRDAGQLVFVDAFGIVEQATDQGALAVVDAAGGRETKQTHGSINAPVSSHVTQKYPSRFLISIEPS